MARAGGGTCCVHPPLHTRGRENDRIVGTAKFENVLKFQPDLIIDIGSVGPTYASLDKQCAGTDKNTAPSMRRRRGTSSWTNCWERRLAAEPWRCDRNSLRARPTTHSTGSILGNCGDRRGQTSRTYHRRGSSGLKGGLAGSINLEELEGLARSTLPQQREPAASVKCR
jgi:iron complex transport system substrate-binding protein